MEPRSSDIAFRITSGLVLFAGLASAQQAPVPGGARGTGDPRGTTGSGARSTAQSTALSVARSAPRELLPATSSRMLPMPERARLTDADGRAIEAPVYAITRPMCSLAPFTTAADLDRLSAWMGQRDRGEPAMVIRSVPPSVPPSAASSVAPEDPPSGPGGSTAATAADAQALSPSAMTIEFTLFGPVPPGAPAVLQAVADLYAASFTDPVTVKMDVIFSATSFGAASSSMFIGVPYGLTRDLLQDDADADDAALGSLPPGATLPARLAIGGPVVQIAETSINFATARALGVDVESFVAPPVIDAALFIGTDTPDGAGVLNFSLTPQAGLPGGTFSALDILTHEVGHALGFVSDVTGPVSGVTAPTTAAIEPSVLDLFRFAASEAPASLGAFSTTPRFYANAAAATGTHVFSDTALVQQLESDVGFQSSHWLNASTNFRGIMDPAIAPTQTRSPALLSESDLAAFDAIGWDRVAAVIVEPPPPQPCNPADLAPTPPGSATFGQLDGNDISAFIASFVSGETAVDLSDTPPGSGTFGQLDGNDISTFITAFLAGCPAS